MKDISQLTEQQLKRLQKAEARKNRKKEKARIRAEFKQKHPAFKWFMRGVNVLVIGFIGFSIYTVGKITYNLYQFYTDTLQWTKITGPALATVQPELLYAKDEHDKQLKLEIISLENEVWDYNKHAFTDKATNEKINELKKKYDNAADPKTYLDEPYNEIMDLWSVKTAIDSLYDKDDHEKFKKDLSIDELSIMIVENFDKIRNYLATETSHEQATTYQNELYKLSDSVASYREAMNSFKTYFEITKEHDKKTKKDVLAIKTTINKKQLSDLQAQLNSLSPKWDLVNSFVLPIVVSANDAANENTKNQALISSYETDQANQANFNEYMTTYTNTLHELESNIIDLPDFTGKTLSDIESWASENNIILAVTYKTTTSGTSNKVLKQTPDPKKYKKIVKGSYVGIEVSQLVTTSSSARHTNNSASSTTSSTYINDSDSLSSTTSTSSTTRTNSNSSN